MEVESVNNEQFQFWNQYGKTVCIADRLGAVRVDTPIDSHPQPLKSRGCLSVSLCRSSAQNLWAALVNMLATKSPKPTAWVLSARARGVGGQSPSDSLAACGEWIVTHCCLIRSANSSGLVISKARVPLGGALPCNRAESIKLNDKDRTREREQEPEQLLSQNPYLRRHDFDLAKGKLHPWERFDRCFVCQSQAECRHHIVQLQNGGNNGAKNVVSLCNQCHAKIHPWLS